MSLLDSYENANPKIRRALERLSTHYLDGTSTGFLAAVFDAEDVLEFHFPANLPASACQQMALQQYSTTISKASLVSIVLCGPCSEPGCADKAISGTKGVLVVPAPPQHSA